MTLLPLASLLWSMGWKILSAKHSLIVLIWSRAFLDLSEWKCSGPQQNPQEFWLMTWWEDEASYHDWHHGENYHNSHKMIPKGLKLVPRTAKITLLDLVSR